MVNHTRRDGGVIYIDKWQWAHLSMQEHSFQVIRAHPLGSQLAF